MAPRSSGALKERLHALLCELMLIPGLSGVRQMTTINWAISSLISGGETLEAARAHLQAIAGSTHTTVNQAAHVMFSSLSFNATSSWLTQPGPAAPSR